MSGFDTTDPSISVAVTGMEGLPYQLVPVRLPYQPNHTHLTQDQARELYEKLGWALEKLDE